MPNDAFNDLEDLDLGLPPAPAQDTYQPDAQQAADVDLAQDLPEAPPEDAYGEVDAPHGAAWEAMLEEEFARKDKNGDGFLSMKEITIKELLELDVDGNGFISMEEFFGVFMKKTEALFLKQDLDRDGRLKPVEFFKGPATPELEASYQRFCGQPSQGLTLDEFRNYLATQRDAPKKR
jgi:hypothetical protein